MSYYLVGALYSFQLILKYAIISVVAGEKMNTGGLLYVWKRIEENSIRRSEGTRARDR